VERIHRWQLAYDCDSDVCLCSAKETSSKKRHKVTFVEDDKLAEVHIVHETSDDPPSLQRFFPSTINCSLLSESVISLRLNFDQPIANYLMFYRKLSESNVSLENVIVASNLQLIGTIKTKNIAHEKSVVIRCTFDCWQSFNDTEAKCIASNQTYCQYDTYEFVLHVPRNIKPAMPSPVQFAICYNADHQQFWDNNDRQNYQVDVISVTDPVIGEHGVEIKPRYSLCESVVWSDVEVALPYW